MKTIETKYRFLFAGGGTGGHLFPAVAVAEQIKVLKPEAEVLFVGTKNKIEGKVIPELGFRFKTIWIKGFARRLSLQNLLFPVRLLVSAVQSLLINMSFKPKVAIGSGGYVAGPAIWGAQVMGAKIILLEQNSYPGITTRLLERFADEVHISFEDSKKYLRRKNILHNTGNPVRVNLGTIQKSEALNNFGLIPEKKTLLVLGGSLGARSINNAVGKIVSRLKENGIQLIWQTGKYYFDEFKNMSSDSVKIFDFLVDMNTAYSACDLLLTRSGATTIAEILALGIPAVLAPSPNVAENHQHFNAESLVNKNAAVLIENKNLETGLLETITEIIFSEEKLDELKRNALALSKPDAAKVIAQNALMYAEA